VKRCLCLLHKLEDIFCSFGLLVVTAVLFVNVVLRYFFRSGLHWSDEFIRYFMIWISFIGISLGVREDKLMAVDLILNYSSPGQQRVIKFINNILGAVFGVLLCYYGIQSVGTMSGSAQVSPALEMPMYIFYIAIPLSGALMTLEFICGAIRSLTAEHAEEQLTKEGGEA
jgi:C4-dicarboxylate transporter DctQ subunit